MINYFITYSPVTAETKNELKKAHKEYAQGELSKVPGERQEAFNKALTYYASFESQYRPQYGNGKLYYDLANSYFQVGQYPMAAFYYYQAQKLMPRDKKMATNLAEALKKLGIAPKKEGSVFNRIFFFHNNLSLPERLQTFFTFSFLGLLAGSLYIWNRQTALKNAAILLTFLSGVMLCSLGYTHYISPTEGILIRSSALYRDAGLQYAKVSEEPLLSGIKVEVLDVVQKGKWIKVFTPDDKLGYVPQESIRIIAD